METEAHKPHRVPRGSRQDKNPKEKIKGSNPKAFAIQSVNKARKKFEYSLDK